jgi:hypothetical protein
MSNLIYFQSAIVSGADEFVHGKEYPNHNWFNLKSTVDGWGDHLCSRSIKLNTPWPLADSVSTIPPITNNETRFDIVLDEIAEKFCSQVKQTQRTPYVMWSGGIDSVSILVSLLRTANKQVLDKLVVVCNQSSLDENPYFYHKYIKNKFTTVDTDQFKITAENYNKILLVNGDCAEMIFGSTHPYTLARRNQMYLIHESCHDDTMLRRSIKAANPEILDFSLDLIKQSIKHSPVPIETVYDFHWWHCFDFKIVDSLLRPMAYLAKHLSDEQTADFFQNTFQRFYMYPEMQIWSMLTKNTRRENMHIDCKYDAKKYIHAFDRNDFYLNNKQKWPSLIKNPASKYIFAIDKTWRRYSVANVQDRRMLGQWLGRI